jgi:hypothetical protein
MILFYILMEDSYTDSDFKEIARNHMQKMNQHFEDFLEVSNFKDQNDGEFFSNKNNTINKNLSTQNAYKLYYFDFLKSSDFNDEFYQNFEFYYQIPETINSVKISIKINKEVLENFGKFYQDWIECKTFDSVFWYNQHLNKSTWENPYLIFITLLENKVNPKWIILDWEDIDSIEKENQIEDNKQTNILIIKYISEEENFLYLDKSTKVSNR